MDFKGLTELVKNRNQLPKDGAIYIPTKLGSNGLWDCTLIALNDKERKREIREGALLVPYILKGKNYTHWLEVSTLTDLVKHINATDISYESLAKIFILKFRNKT